MPHENRHPDINVLREVDDLMVLVRHVAPLWAAPACAGSLAPKDSAQQIAEKTAAGPRPAESECPFSLSPSGRARKGAPTHGAGKLPEIWEISPG
jgi:hypothetical protein